MVMWTRFSKFDYNFPDMKNTLLVICVMAALVSCKKDKFNSVPQVSFVDMTNNYVPRNLTAFEKPFAPKMILKITDSEGDFGVSSPTDSSWIVIRHLLTNSVDSVRFPDLSRAPKKDFDAEVTVNMFDFLDCRSSGPVRPSIDTIFYEVYVRDWKNNKSNTITTTTPILRNCE